MENRSRHRAARIDIIPWNDAFRTGFSDIDHQHQGLVAILNGLATRLAYPTEPFGISTLLEDLQSYTEQHFQTEEQLWHSYLDGTSSEVQHRELHAGFIKFVQELRARQNNLAEDQVVLEAMSYLTHWLVVHILESDRRMALMVQSQQSGASLEQAKLQAEELMRKEHRLLIDLVVSVYGSLSQNSVDLIQAMTEQRSLLHALEEREHYVQTLLEQMPVPLLICDEQYQIIRVNVAFAQTFAEHQDVICLQFDTAQKHSSPSCFAGWSEALKQLAESGLLHTSSEVLVRRPDGLERTVLLRAADLNHAESHQYLVTLYDVSDRILAEQERESERVFLRTLIHTLPDLVWFKDRDGVYLACNPSFERFFGASEAEIVGKTDADFVAEELAQSFRKHDQFAMDSGRPVRNEEWITLAEDGRHVLLETTKTPMRDVQGEVIGVLGIGHDFTERFLREQALRDSEARFHALYSAMTEGVALHQLLYDEDGTPCDYLFLGVNPAFEHHTGLKKSDVLGKKASEMFGFVPYLHDYATVVEQGESRHFEAWFEPMQKVFAITSVRPATGQFATIFRDITNQVKLEADLRQTSARLQGVLESTPIPMILLDHADQLTYVNQAFQTLFGYGLDKVNVLDQWLGMVFPEDTDRDHNRQKVQRLWQVRSDKVPAAEPIVLRMMTTEGQDRTVMAHLTLLLDQDSSGKEGPLRLITLVDLTEQTAAHAEIVRLKDSLESTLNALPDIVFEVDLEGFFQAWHAPGNNVFGIGPDDVAGKTITDVLPTEAAQLFSDALLEAAQHGTSTVTPFLIDTHAKRAWLNISVLRKKHDSGLQPGFVVIIRDVSERMRSEELMDLRQTLADMVFTHERRPLLMTALAAVERMSESQVSFYHILDSSEARIEEYAWSLNTLQSMQLQRDDASSDFPVWAECIKLRQTVVLNEQAGVLYKQDGLAGAMPLSRLVLVPVFQGQRLVAIMGVANRRSAYDQQTVALVAHLSNIIYEIIDRQKSEKRIKQMAFSDALTELPNRQLFRDRLQQAVALGKRSARLLAVCYFDLDGFKPVNDRFGHAAGDQLLIQLAHRLQHELREGDTLARIGGDEFVVLLNDLDNVSSGEKIIRRFLHSISHPFDIEGHHIEISASMGVTYYPLDPSHPDMLMRHADQAMYQAKQSGKNAFRLYEGIEVQQSRVMRHALEEFELALDNDELRLDFQPRIELATGEPVGFEGLVRWHHPQRGILDPAEFFPLILDHALEFRLDCWVLERARDQLLAWHAQGMDLFLSVNVNARHVRDLGFPEELSSILSGCPAEVCQKLELEVTEVAALGDTEHAARIMRQCLNLGVRFALDDFGLSYASLTCLYRLPFALLKIDQNRVRDILDDQQDQDVVEGVLHLAASLKMPAVAEGVESIEHGLMLAAQGCPFAQGFGIARPMPAEAIPDWIQNWRTERHWHDLWLHRDSQQIPYDIHVAMYSHRRWLELVRDVGSGTGQQYESLVAAVSGCQVSRWLDGIGMARYSQRPSFGAVQVTHLEVHQKTRLLVDTLQSKTGSSEPLLADVEASSERLLASLQRLAQE